MFKINMMKAIKITLGCCLCFYNCECIAFGIQHFCRYHYFAEHILNPKRDTLIVAWKRSVAFLLASSIAIISFTIFRFSVWGSGRLFDNNRHSLSGI